MKKTPLKRKTPLKKAVSRKSFQRTEKYNVEQREKAERSEKMFDVFLAVWGSRDHRCQSCNTYLGSEPKTFMFDHLLEKSSFPQFALDHENIYLCCWDCHTIKTAGHPTSNHQEAIEAYKQKNL